MIVIGSDHGGFELKGHIKAFLLNRGIEVTDMGCYDENSVDYPDIAQKVCNEFLTDKYEFAVLICGTGIGISIAANKIDGIRCALLANEYSAVMSKRHNNANVIALGGRVTGRELACSIIEAYMSTEFEGGRHEKRIEKIHQLEK